MGRSGTDVAREAADIILLDDNFASIAAAVEEGRAVYDNIRRFAQYHFSSNVAELLAFLVWGLSGGAIPLPLVVMQVLAIDLGHRPAAGDRARAPSGPSRASMERPPRPRSERLLNRRVLARVYGFVGLLVGHRRPRRASSPATCSPAGGRARRCPTTGTSTSRRPR